MLSLSSYPLRSIRDPLCPWLHPFMIFWNGFFHSSSLSNSIVLPTLIVSFNLTRVYQRSAFVNFIEQIKLAVSSLVFHFYNIDFRSITFGYFILRTYILILHISVQVFILYHSTYIMGFVFFVGVPENWGNLKFCTWIFGFGLARSFFNFFVCCSLPGYRKIICFLYFLSQCLGILI